MLNEIVYSTNNSAFISFSDSTYRRRSCKTPAEDAQGSSCRLLLFVPLATETGWPEWQNNRSPSGSSFTTFQKTTRCKLKEIDIGEGVREQEGPKRLSSPAFRRSTCQCVRRSLEAVHRCWRARRQEDKTTPPLNVFSTTVSSSRFYGCRLAADSSPAGLAQPVNAALWRSGAPRFYTSSHLRHPLTRS